MKPVHTPFTNTILGANQDEYLSLPAHALNDPMGHIVTCWELDSDDILNLKESDGKIWVTQSTFNNPFHPLIVSTEPPYDQPEDKEQPEEHERPD